MMRYFNRATRLQLCRDLAYQKECRDDLHEIVKGLNKERETLISQREDLRDQRDTAFEHRDSMRRARDKAVTEYEDFKRRRHILDESRDAELFEAHAEYEALKQTMARHRTLLFNERAALREKLGSIIREYVGSHRDNQRGDPDGETNQL